MTIKVAEPSGSGSERDADVATFERRCSLYRVTEIGWPNFNGRVRSLTYQMTGEIDHSNLVALGDKTIDEMAADESSRSSYRNNWVLHIRTPHF